MYVQGKVNIQQNCRIVGGECLARWIHPEKGLIPPDQFIPLFEHNGMITQLDRLMFEKACAWLHDYLEAGRRSTWRSTYRGWICSRTISSTGIRR